MLDVLIHQLQSGAYMPAFLLLAYGLLRLVKDDTHWLNNGRVAVVAAAVIAGLAQLAPIAMTGATPNLQAIIAALGTAYALYLSPHPAEATKLADAAAKLPQATLKG